MKAIALKFKRLIWVSLFCIALIGFPLIGHAVTVEDVPNPRQISGGWVTDMAEILSEDTETKLNQMISELEAENGAEIAVVTVQETAPAASPKAFATELFNHWGIGKAGEDNGVLFLISKGDRRVEIETGYGIEPILPDAKVGEIIETQITPLFKQGDFDGGTLAGTKALVVELGKAVNTIPIPKTNSSIVTKSPYAHQASNRNIFLESGWFLLLGLLGIPIGILWLLAAAAKGSISGRSHYSDCRYLGRRYSSSGGSSSHSRYSGSRYSGGGSWNSSSGNSDSSSSSSSWDSSDSGCSSSDFGGGDSGGGGAGGDW